VPDYLPEVPQDPIGDGELVDHGTNGGHLVDGVGPDGSDDGGVPYDWRIWPPQPSDDSSLVDPPRFRPAATPGVITASAASSSSR
jgi:hypothetical protein